MNFECYYIYPVKVQQYRPSYLVLTGKNTPTILETGYGTIFKNGSSYPHNISFTVLLWNIVDFDFLISEFSIDWTNAFGKRWGIAYKKKTLYKTPFAILNI